MNWAFAILFPLSMLLSTTVLALIVPLDNKSENVHIVNQEEIQQSVLLETLLKSSHNVPRVVEVL